MYALLNNYNNNNNKNMCMEIFTIIINYQYEGVKVYEGV